MPALNDLKPNLSWPKTAGKFAERAKQGSRYSSNSADTSIAPDVFVTFSPMCAITPFHRAQRQALVRTHCVLVANGGRYECRHQEHSSLRCECIKCPILSAQSKLGRRGSKSNYALNVSGRGVLCADN